MQTVRIWFRKTGTAKYISHLDLTRCMARIMRRAGVPAWYTEGFNPHLFMTFAMPLSLGQEGLRESMDIKLPEDTDLSAIPARMNQTVPEGIEILQAALPVMKPEKIAFAAYEITLTPENSTSEALTQQLRAVLAEDDLPAVKKTKVGERTLNLKDYLNEYTLSADAENVLLHIVLPAGCKGNVNPALLTDCLTQRTQLPFSVRIVRQEAFDEEKKTFA